MNIKFSFRKHKLLCCLLLFSHYVMSGSLWPHGLQHARPPCPSTSRRLLKIMSIELVMASNHFILSPSSLFAFHLSWYQGLFQWISCLYQVAKVLQLQLQHQSFQWIFFSPSKTLGLIGLISLLFQGLSRVFSSTIVWKHQFFGALPSLWFSIHICAWLFERP